MKPRWSLTLLGPALLGLFVFFTEPVQQVGFVSADALRNKQISATAPTDNQILKFDSASDTWVAEADVGISASSTDTLTNKTIDGDDNTFVDVPWTAGAAGTDGEIPTWGADAEPATVAAGTSGQVLTSNGAGSAPTFQAAAGGSWSLLVADSGTSTNTSAENVDTVAISGLTGLDKIVMYYTLECVTQNCGTPLLYNDTDSVTIVNLDDGTFSATHQIGGHAYIQQMQSGTTAVAGSANYLRLDSSLGERVGNVATFTTAWTGSWTLALRSSGVVSGGTLRWSWSVHKVAGQ